MKKTLENQNVKLIHIQNGKATVIYVISYLENEVNKFQGTYKIKLNAKNQQFIMLPNIHSASSNGTMRVYL